MIISPMGNERSALQSKNQVDHPVATALRWDSPGLLANDAGCIRKNCGQMVGFLEFPALESPVRLNLGLTISHVAGAVKICATTRAGVDHDDQPVTAVEPVWLANCQMQFIVHDRHLGGEICKFSLR